MASKGVRESNGERQRTISQCVVEEVAATAGVEPTALDVPLYAAINTDALNDLFANRSAPSDAVDRRVEFVYAGHEVVVTGDGTVTVSETSDSLSESAVSDV